jgi:hypothetical protein
VLREIKFAFFLVLSVKLFIFAPCFTKPTNLILQNEV